MSEKSKKIVLSEDDILQFNDLADSNLNGFYKFLETARYALVKSLYKLYPHLKVFLCDKKSCIFCWTLSTVGHIDEHYPMYTHHYRLMSSDDVFADVVAHINYATKSVEAYVRPVSS